MKLSSSSSAKYNDEALWWFKDIKLNKKIKKGVKRKRGCQIQ